MRTLTCGRRGARADVMEWGVYNRQYPKQPRSHHCNRVSSYADTIRCGAQTQDTDMGTGWCINWRHSPQDMRL